MEYITIPILCYALEAIDLSKSELSSLDYTYKRALFKVFKVPNADDLNFYMNIFNISSISDRYSKKGRILKVAWLMQIILLCLVQSAKSFIFVFHFISVCYFPSYYAAFYGNCRFIYIHVRVRA